MAKYFYLPLLAAVCGYTVAFWLTLVLGIAGIYVQELLWQLPAILTGGGFALGLLLADEERSKAAKAKAKS